MKKVIIFLGSVMLCNALSSCIFEEERPREGREGRVIIERPGGEEHRH